MSFTEIYKPVNSLNDLNPNEKKNVRVVVGEEGRWMQYGGRENGYAIFRDGKDELKVKIEGMSFRGSFIVVDSASYLEKKITSFSS